jgi:hypothetical protein
MSYRAGIPLLRIGVECYDSGDDVSNHVDMMVYLLPATVRYC